MSKTDKTRPWWVDQWWEPCHGYYCAHRNSLYRPATFWPCDLPTEPPNGPPQRRNMGRVIRRLDISPGCYWYPDSPSYYSPEGRKLFGRGRHVGVDANLAERGVRAAWRAAATMLRAVRPDDVDDVVLPDPRHRHNVEWWDW